MKKSLCVFNSDKVNKYNEVFPVSTLETAIEQKWKTGTPMHMNHDYHRPIGWTYPFSLLFEPSVTKLLGMAIFPENDKELEVVNNIRANYLKEENERDCKPYKKELQNKLKEVLTGRENFLRVSCVSVMENGIAKKVFPDIFNNLDDDGLYCINKLKHLGSGVFEINGLAIFAHPYFRRSFSRLNNLNIAFFDYIDKLKQKYIEIKIAFDPDLVGLPATYLKPMELEYWWGPKFDDDLLKISPGVTRHTANEIDKEFYRIAETDFFWYSRKNTKTLEIEEILDIPSFIDKDKYICRYVHSMVNELDSKIFHLDGAVRIYTEDKMIERIDQDLSKSKKNTEYIKLFRIDNNMTISEWKRTISDYFKDNHLIGEYFGEINDRQLQDTKVKSSSSDYIPKLQYSYHPFSLKNEDGFLFNYSYQQKKDEQKYDLDIISFDSLTIEEDQINYFEAPTWELLKLFKTRQVDINIHADYQTIAFEDFYYNFPLIVIYSRDKVAVVFSVFLELLKFYSKNVLEERQISFSIEYPLLEHNIRLSFLGSASCLLSFFNANGIPPTLKGDLITYINKVSIFLRTFNEINNKETLAVVKNSAMLVYDRHFLNGEVNVKLHFSEDDGHHYYDITNIKDKKLYESLSNGELEICTASIIYEEECNKCGKNYFKCDCNIINGDTYKIVKDFKPIGLYYTDKKA